MYLLFIFLRSARLTSLTIYKQGLYIRDWNLFSSPPTPSSTMSPVYLESYFRLVTKKFKLGKECRVLYPGLNWFDRHSHIRPKDTRLPLFYHKDCPWPSLLMGLNISGAGCYDCSLFTTMSRDSRATCIDEYWSRACCYPLHWCKNFHCRILRECDLLSIL